MPDHIDWIPPSYSGEALSEFAGRLCYLSFSRGGIDGHASVEGRRSTNEYFEHVLEVAHGSILEHAIWSILFEGVSRTWTHEMVRHRAGYGFSQLSQRFVDESDVGFVVPPLILKLGENRAAYESWRMSCSESLGNYQELLANLGLDMSLSQAVGEPGTIEKKRLREAAREVLLPCAETKILVTGNARAWRNFLEQRGASGASLEMIRSAEFVAPILKDEAPSIFQDVHLLGSGVEVLHRKV
jgi:thymidylate synthase (FAD)